MNLRLSDDEIMGRVGFGVSVRIGIDELRGWTPERLARLFAGIAQALAAVNNAPPNEPPPPAVRPNSTGGDAQP